MKIMISPAKKMRTDPDTLPVSGLPRFLDKTEILMCAVQELDYARAKALWKCSDHLAELNFQRFREMDLCRGLTPAVLAYEGLQYQHMAPGVLTDRALGYLGEHLRILSGFYGVLAPFEGVVPYRLEMQAPLRAGGKRDLYEFWGRQIYEALLDPDRQIINLASREYAKAVEPYLSPGDRFLTLEFGELEKGKLKQKGTFAKMARGEMVRFLAENQVEDPEEIKTFRGLGLAYREELSDESRFCFTKEKKGESL